MELRCAQFEFLLAMLDEATRMNARLPEIETWDRDRLSVIGLAPEDFKISVMRRLMCHAGCERVREGRPGSTVRVQRGLYGLRLREIRRSE